MMNAWTSKYNNYTDENLSEKEEDDGEDYVSEPCAMMMVIMMNH